MAKINVTNSGSKSYFDSAIAHLNNSKEADKLYKKLDQYQLDYYNNLVGKSYSVIVCDEKAGTGKTTIAVLAGLELYRNGKVNCVIYIRFPDNRAGKLGFLTGDQNEKEMIYTTPFYDACCSCGLTFDDVDALRDCRTLIATTDIGLRGVNFENAFVIIDEAQNGDIPSLRTVLTRVHDSCKVALIGHSRQMDNILEKVGKYIPFELFQIHMTKKCWSISNSLPINYRGKISKWADEIDETIKEYK